MRTILVTGGAGFIGANLVHHLARKYPEDRLVVLDLLTYAGSIEHLPQEMLQARHPRLRFWYGNVCNAALVDMLVSEADVVLHLAAETHVTRSIFDGLSFFQTDVLGTQTVVNAVVKAGSKVKRFIHVSSSEVYGTASKDAMDEQHPLNPMSPYASAKCGADRLVYSYWATYGIPAVIVRPFNNFGPLQHLEKVVPRFITSCILKEPIRVHGDGAAARDFLYVQDHCEALDALIHAPRESVVGQTFNLGSGRHVTINEIALAVKAAMDSDVPVEFIGDRPGQVFRHTSDSSKIERLLKWKPRTTFERGLEQTARWYRDHEAWWRPQMWLRQIPIITAGGRRELH